MSSSNKNIMVKYLIKKNGEFNKEYQNMTMMQGFKQFFTPEKYSQHIINELKYLEPSRIIDLAIGEGSLLKEAIVRWGNAKYFGNDIDKNCCNKIHQDYPTIKCFNKNIFKYSTIDKLIPKTEPIDLCLGNPPFDLIPQNKSIKKILKLFNLDKVYTSKKIPAELIFTLQCLRIVSDDGTIALILPDGFFVNSYLKQFRQFLIETYHIEKIVELPDNIFTKTEAKTHILIFKKQSAINTNINLSTTDHQTIIITKQEAINRMDYSYYANSLQSITDKCIKDFDIDVIRGKAKHMLTDVNSRHILHTTNFSKGDIFSNGLKSSTKLLKYRGRLAKPGDIILARVGSYCLGNIGIVQKGYFVATDCVFIIRVKDKNLRKNIFNSLKSIYGQNWIKANSKGVAAKHITLEDIKKFPLSYREQ